MTSSSSDGAGEVPGAVGASSSASHEPDPASSSRRGASRRTVLGLSAAGIAGLLGGAAVGRVTAAGTGAFPLGTAADGVSTMYSFTGAHQAGIDTAVQDHLHFAAFDLMEGVTREELIELLQDWSYAASRITQGLDVSVSGAVGGGPYLPPDDTGEAIDLPPSGLTVTIGFGPTLFEKDGVDRFGIADQRPENLSVLPPFLGETLKTQWCHGDLCIQACADDPQVAVHAVRNLSRIAFGRAAVRWSQMGFGRTSRTTSEQKTPRNLFGFKDGTANILADDTDTLAASVWVADGDGPDWMTGGTYLASRKIEMLLETWDRVQLQEQENIFGRNKLEGAPLTGGDEFAGANLTEESDGAPVIDIGAHMRLAHPDSNEGTKMLRRGYNYVDGTNPYGRLDAGLFFLAYVRDLEQFIRVQRNLSTDLLNEYIRHIGSSSWAIPPGVEPGGWIGETLFV